MLNKIFGGQVGEQIFEWGKTEEEKQRNYRKDIE